MHLGELLLGYGLVTPDEVDEALERQAAQGGRLGENLLALGYLTAVQLSTVIDGVPAVPSTVGETGVPERNLLNLMLKLMHVEALGTARELAQRMKLGPRIVQGLLDEASHLRLAQSMGSVPGESALLIRYSLSDLGKAAAKEALDQNLYLGPAPVSLASYQTQIERQRITNEDIDEDTLRRSFDNLVVPDHYIEKLLPAVNAGRTVLLFGAPGNGKSTLAARMATVFRDVVYIPYAVDIGGQIITVYDPRLHKPAVCEEDARVFSSRLSLDRERFDERWVACKRPVAITGGELTLDMLDLQFNPTTKFYEAPLHIKALNGILLIDDFGRQNFDPALLLNRWIIPMENQVDYLKLHSGTTFPLPFDGLVIFSTNLDPSDLMDPAFLRRIPYKIKLFSPSREDYWEVFDGVARRFGLELTKPVFELVVERLDKQFGLAYYQPKFICQQVIEASRSFRRRPQLTRESVLAALANLYYDIENERSPLRTPAPLADLRMRPPAYSL